MTGVLTRVATIERVWVDDQHVGVQLFDGREVTIPLDWSQRLTSANPKERANYEIEAFGTSIHWQDVDEDIGLETFLGVSEDVIYDALGWEKPSKTTEEYIELADAEDARAGPV